MTTLERVRAEIAEYGSIWVQYQIQGHTDRDIAKLVEDVLQQAKSQVLALIDKYAEQEPTSPCDLCIFYSMDGDDKYCGYCGECPATAKGGE